MSATYTDLITYFLNTLKAYSALKNDDDLVITNEIASTGLDDSVSPISTTQAGQPRKMILIDTPNSENEPMISGSLGLYTDTVRLTITIMNQTGDSTAGTAPAELQALKANVLKAIDGRVVAPGVSSVYVKSLPNPTMTTNQAAQTILYEVLHFENL